MNSSQVPEKQQRLANDVLGFIARSQGLTCEVKGASCVRVVQSIDGKSIEFNSLDLEDVLFRSDSTGDQFIQINFISGKKILLTRTLVGFKPVALRGIDSSRLPRVVTTPDILSVFEAIQDSLHSVDADPHEILILKRIFEAVLTGGETVGFDLSTERGWIKRIPQNFTRIAS